MEEDKKTNPENNSEGKEELVNAEAQSTDLEKESSTKADFAAEADEDNINDDPATFTSVASTPRNQKVAFIIFGIATAIFLYFTINNFILAPTGGEEEQVDNAEEESINQETLDDAVAVTKLYDFTETTRQVPNLPELQPLAEPTPPSPPPISIPSLPPTPSIETVPEAPEEEGNLQPPAPPVVISDAPAPPEPAPLSILSDKNSEAFEKRRKASISVYGSSAAAASLEGQVGGTTDNSNFTGFGGGKLDRTTIQPTASEQVKATHVGDLSTMILQGKIIHAVLETAINTDLEGSVRAIITRDIYAESGKRVLIPKGSRVIGGYKSDVTTGSPRVGINWERLIRPDGVDIQIGSKGVDALGRSGVVGDLDNKFWLRLASAFMVSYLIPVAAQKISNVGNDDSVTSTSNTDGSSSTSGSFRSQQLKESTDKFNEIASEIIQDTFNTEATITVNQGEIVNIFVQKDLIFPTDNQLANLKSQGGIYR